MELNDVPAETQTNGIVTWLKSLSDGYARFLPTITQFAVSVGDLPHISDADWDSMTVIPPAARKRMRIAIQSFASSTNTAAALRAWLIGINPSYECYADALLTISRTPDDLRFVTDGQWESVAIPDAVKRKLRDVLGASRVGSADDNESTMPKFQHRGVPVIDPHWIARTEIVEQLVEQLCSGDGSTVGIVGVAGMGGIGKTTLSVLVARHPKVMERFPDGIYWLTLGDDCKDALPLQKLLAAYRGWSKARREEQLQTAAGAVEPLRAEFKGLRCLLILDDVWNSAIAQYLMVLDASCAKVFISTRNQDVLTRLHSTCCLVDYLQSHEAIEVFCKYSEWKEAEVQHLQAFFQPLWKRCGGLALAIAMTAAVLSEMPHTTESVVYVEKQLESQHGVCAHLDGYDKYHSVYAAIEPSLNMLDDKLPLELLTKTRFRDLAVYQEDAAIGIRAKYERLPTLRQLWMDHKRSDAMDEQTARLVVQKLVQRCLLIQVGEDEYKLQAAVWAYLNATVTSDQERDDICLRLAESVQEPWILEYVLRLVMLPLCWATSDFGVDTFRFRQRWVQRTECLQWMLKDSSVLPNGEHILCLVQDEDVLQEMIQLRPSIIQEAVQWHGVDYGRTVLHWCQSSSVVKLLCDAGANANALDNDGETPLYCALRYHIEDDYSIAQQLVECGADVNNVSRKYHSAITACAFIEIDVHHPAVRWLVQLQTIDRKLALQELMALDMSPELPAEWRSLLLECGWDLTGWTEEADHELDRERIVPVIDIAGENADDLMDEALSSSQELYDFCIKPRSHIPLNIARLLTACFEAQEDIFDGISLKVSSSCFISKSIAVTWGCGYLHKLPSPFGIICSVYRHNKMDEVTRLIASYFPGMRLQRGFPIFVEHNNLKATKLQNRVFYPCCFCCRNDPAILAQSGKKLDTPSPFCCDLGSYGTYGGHAYDRATGTPVGITANHVVRREGCLVYNSRSAFRSLRGSKKFDIAALSFEPHVDPISHIADAVSPNSHTVGARVEGMAATSGRVHGTITRGKFTATFGSACFAHGVECVKVHGDALGGDSGARVVDAISQEVAGVLIGGMPNDSAFLYVDAVNVEKELHVRFGAT